MSQTAYRNEMIGHGKRWPLIATLVLFALLVAALNVFHDMWLDELQHWCLARDSRSLSELLSNTRNEGHPPLWHLLLWSITRVTTDPGAMQVLNAVIALATAALVLWRAPFPLLWRILIVFGYFFLFEYAAIARNYGIGVMLALLAADQYHRHGIGWRWATLLIMLSQVHLWSIILTSAWCATILLTDRNASKPLITVIMLACAIGLWRCLPEVHLNYGVQWDQHPRWRDLGSIGSLAAQAFLPWPDLSRTQAWNTNVLHQHPLVLALLGWMLLANCVRLLREDRASMWFFLLSSIGIIAFPLLCDFRGTRYVGPLVLAMMIALWISERPAIARSNSSRTAIATLLALQVVGGVLAVILGTTRTFSQSRNVVDLLRSRDLAELPVMIDRYAAGPSISAYLRRPVHYLNGAGEGSSCIWWHEPFDLTDPEFRDAVGDVQEDRFVLLTQRPEVLKEMTGVTIELQGIFTHGLIAHEDQQVLLVSRTLHHHATR